MEKARRRIRLCLLLVVLAAVCVGIAYYYYNVGSGSDITQGTLIANVINGWESSIGHGSWW